MQETGLPPALADDLGILETPGPEGEWTFTVAAGRGVTGQHLLLWGSLLFSGACAIYAALAVALGWRHGSSLFSLGLWVCLPASMMLQTGRPSQWRLKREALSVRGSNGQIGVQRFGRLGVRRRRWLLWSDWELTVSDGAVWPLLTADQKEPLVELAAYVSARTGLPFDQEVVGSKDSRHTLFLTACCTLGTTLLMTTDGAPWTAVATTAVLVAASCYLTFSGMLLQFPGAAWVFGLIAAVLIIFCGFAATGMLFMRGGGVAGAIAAIAFWTLAVVGLVAWLARRAQGQQHT